MVVPFLLSCALLGPPAALAAPATITEDGYLEVRDGTRLRYHLVRPADQGRHPVVVQYDGYSAGTDPTFGSIPGLEERLLERGFALLGVSIRGTGCSSGVHDLFEPAQAKDGAEAVEWAARQPWSNGRVGMAGYSFPGIMQLLTAAQRPKGLKAIVPSSVVFDLYRDVGYPGGIQNSAFGVLFTEQQKLPGQQETPRVALQGDTECAANFAVHEARNPVIAEQGIRAPYSDSRFGSSDYAARSAMSTAQDIDVPVLTSIYWQDEQTGPRVGGLLEPGGLLHTLPAGRTWALVSNGNHDFNEDNPAYIDLMASFLAHFVGGEDNGFERTPKVTQLHEASLSDGRASWITRSEQLPAPEPVVLQLGGDGRLDRSRRNSDDVTYAAPLPSSSTNPAPYDPTTDAVWAVPAPDAGRAVWTSPPLARDLEVLGSASLDLRIVASAEDLDLQATITEVRADGQEHFVQRGWLRASHRRLDASRSTATRPFHPGRAADVQTLAPGQPFDARLEVLPFGHTFRAGSAIRVILDSPLSVTGNWGFTPVLTPQTVRVITGASQLVLGRVPGEARAAARPCGDLRSLPCRPSIAPVPAGELDLPPLGRPKDSGVPRRAAAAPRSCLSRRSTTIRLARRGRVRAVRVTVNGRRAAARVRGGRVTVSFVGRKAGNVVVRVSGRTANGRVVRTVRRYRLCRPRSAQGRSAGSDRQTSR